ncbi:MAG TPA: TonB-dependent receptor, partial [Agriterribacter sp.]|nr:TonB-dependent receptor [Agriterribacter sp.]
GEAIAGVSIYFADAKTGAITNEGGFYSIKNIAAGTYLIEVSSIGYASITEQVTLTGDLQKNFALVPSILENEGVTVTGVSTATKIKRTPTPVTIMSKKELNEVAATNLIDALSKNPGVAQVSTGPSISKPVIRGLGYNRVVVLNDGIRQEGQQWGDEHGIEIDEYSVNKVEILKGPASIIYGSDAMAGVINILTNTPAPEGTIKGNIIANYQTNNKFTGFGANISGNKNGLNWNAYGSFKGAQDYKNKYDGYVFNSKYNEKNLGGYIGYNGSWGYSHIIVSSFNQEPGLIEGDRDDLTGQFIHEVNNNGTAETKIAEGSDFSGIHPDLPRQRVQHFKVAADNRFNVGDGKISLNIGFQNNKRKEYADVFNANTPNLYFNLNTITYTAQYHIPFSSEWKTVVGLNGMLQSNENKAEEVLIPEYHLFDAGVFVYTQKNYDRFTISGGLRFDSRTVDSKKALQDNEIKFEAFTKSFRNISGSAGISYEAAKTTTLKFNIARGFRAPGIAELASNGTHEGTNRYEYGNQNLQSETSLQSDLGVEVNTTHLSLSATGFINEIDHFIFYRKLSGVNGGDSLVNVDGDDITAFTFDQAKALLYGAEMSLDIHPHPLDWLHFENIFSYVRGKFDQPIEGVNNIPFIPAARLITQLKGEFVKKGKRVSNLSITAELDNTFSQNKAFTAYNTETTTKGYSLLNAFIGADIKNHKKILFSLYVTGNNLTNMAYQNHLSRLKYTDVNNVTGRVGVFNMGRNFSIKINVPLSF